MQREEAAAPWGAPPSHLEASFICPSPSQAHLYSAAPPLSPDLQGPLHPTPSTSPTGPLRPDLSGIPASASCSEEMKVTCLLPFAVSLTPTMYLGHEQERGSSLPQRLKSRLTCGLLLDAKPWHWDAEGVHPRAKGLIQKEVTGVKRHCRWNAPPQFLHRSLCIAAWLP